MRVRGICVVGLVVWLGSQAALAADDATCIDCHVAAYSEHLDAMRSSPHWNAANPAAPVNANGCRACHGPSTKHIAAPTKLQPDVSFGPRWTSSVAVQNGACLTCHTEGKPSGWKTGVHAAGDLTCTNCHDSHARDDAARIAGSQAEFCTVCHKVQKDGMHHLPERLADNPPCTTCHNPHADPRPQLTMLDSRSAGCRTCHDLQQMLTNPSVSPKANSYHKTMQSPDRTCIDCHSGVAHVDTADFAAVLAGGFTSHELMLFYPGQSDSEWILGEHPGAQSLRQGRNCRQCHLGEAESLGNKLAPAGIKPTVSIELSFARAGGQLEVSISWTGEANANDVAVMFGGDEVEDFARGGCWATCHSDMPGMTRDRNQGIEKYLRASRAQLRSIGRPPIIHDAGTLAEMTAAGAYVELWRANLAQATVADVEVYRVLDRRDRVAEPVVTARGGYVDGRWTVTFSRPLADARKSIEAGRTYTLGVALHGDGKSGADHWVSLPVTLSLDGIDTDFVAKQQSE